ncbi:MAG: hypothetical protein GTN49_01810, partial [candidate division Zixibacteria bacterium]|nr:hypothetical protein [candidate division Zixibacteria bacterium]
MKTVLIILEAAALAAAAWALPPPYTYVGKWGSLGSGNGQFSYPRGIAVVSNRNIYVVDSNNHRIQYFTLSGSFLGKWGSLGTGNGQFSYPRGIAVVSNGNIYVVDSNNHRIQ